MQNSGAPLDDAIPMDADRIGVTDDVDLDVPGALNVLKTGDIAALVQNAVDKMPGQQRGNNIITFRFGSITDLSMTISKFMSAYYLITQLSEETSKDAQDALMEQIVQQLK